MEPIDGVDNEIKSSAIELIGNTPLVALDRLYPGPGRILAKCEFMNPGGSIKCRASLNMVKTAIESGDLEPGRPVIEITSGNQGCGLAVVCSVLGHPLTVVMSKGNSVQRCIHMEALGTNCIRVPQVEGTYGSVTFRDVRAGEEVCEKIVKETNAFYVCQFNNPANVLAHYNTTGPEIWRQTGRRINAFVTTVGTGGTVTGVSKYLKEQDPTIKTFVVEPEGAAAIKGEPVTKPLHLLQGSGYGCVPELFNYEYLDEVVTVTDDEVMEYKKLIGEKEGLFVGYTSAANVAAAVKILKSGKLPEDAWVATILFDTGLKYTPVPEELTK